MVCGCRATNRVEGKTISYEAHLLAAGLNIPGGGILGPVRDLSFDKSLYRF